MSGAYQFDNSSPVTRGTVKKIIEETSPHIARIKFDSNFNKVYEKPGPANLNRSPLSKPKDFTPSPVPQRQPYSNLFESNVNDYEQHVRQDIYTNNEYMSRPNAIIESYKELPPATSLVYGPSSTASLHQLMPARESF